MKKTKPAKKASHAFKPMVWTKKSDFIYEAKDPMTGGFWSYVSKCARTQDELNADVVYALHNKLKQRPRKGGPSATLVVPHRMTLAESQGLLSEIEARTKTRP
jgi:hypothetical protein